ncbi:hypothetical protein ACQPX6_03605 [Actinomycetospora sp. CA-101289]|uniref:hypothetical protein n=1 Tax=Actinomycetospora sp. CA-101289 TaxID=3239893 RepID=UPI003D99F340
MARHRADGARTATPPPPSTSTRTDLGALLPQQGLGAAHPSGPLPRVGRGARRPAPAALPPVAPVRASETSPLDLAAIALAAASARRAGLPEVGTSPTGGTATAAVPRTAADLPADPSTGGTPRPAYPAAVPSALAPPTPSHAVPAVGRGRPGRRVPLPTRTAGALAFVGALAAGGVAVVGGSAMLGDDPTPPTGELRVSEAGTAAAAVAPAAATPSPAASSAERSTPRDAEGGGRHRADRTGDAQDSGGY